MKGLLHRLAARAAGTALPVRSVARLPYGGGLAWAEEPLHTDRGPVRDRLPETVAARPGVAIQRAEPEPTLATEIASTDASIEATAEANAAPEPGQVHGRSTVALPDPVPQAAELSVPRPPFSARDEHSQPEPLVPEPAPLPATGMPVEWDDRKPAPALAYRSDGLSRRSAAFPLVEPASLMPSARVQVDASLPMSAPAAQARDDTTEVHIHIGRIDVTAVREAPAPRNPSRERKSPMSLDAYLGARTKS